MVFQSDITEINKRGLKILGSLSIFWYVLVLTYASIGAGTGHFYSQNIKPFEEGLTRMAESFVKSLESGDSYSPEFPESAVKIQTNNNVNTATDSGTKQETQQTEYYYAEPTVVYTYPTAEPGKPGSKEWEEQFWKDWNETNAYIDQKNAEVQQSQSEFNVQFKEQQAENEAFKKQVEESQKKFCEENPDLCN